MVKYFSNVAFMMYSMLLFLSIMSFVQSGNLLIYGEYIIEWEILTLNSSAVYLIFLIDFTSMFFMSTVSLISMSVYFFSNSYMMNEKFFSRFHLLVMLFIASMFLLIFSPNMLSILLGWDGLGVTSYLLVIYYNSSKSYNAGMITAMTNRLGDVGLLMCIGLMMIMGDWTITYLSFFNNKVGTVFLILLTLSACTKSAQMPFSAWLPAAMAAPTPVSALVHSSTLVTAGVYLIVRFHNVLYGSNVSTYLFMIGIFTMLMAGMSAMFETDMKKIIALSTLSQLGVMMMVLGANYPLLAFFHLISHAYFKAMLFMCAGLVIHNMSDYQDIRNMGNSMINMPLSMSIMSVANLSLCGLPFLSGFYSKDLMLEMLMMQDINIFLLMIIMSATLLTMMYSLRLSFLLATLPLNFSAYFYNSENDFYMHMGMLMLLPFAIMGGMNMSFMIMLKMPIIYLPVWLKLMITLLIVLSCLFLSMFIKEGMMTKPKYLVFFSGNMWHMPNTFSHSMTNLMLNSAKLSAKMSEVSWLEMLLYFHISKPMKKYSFLSTSMSSSYFIYPLFMFLWMMML